MIVTSFEQVRERMRARLQEPPSTAAVMQAALERAQDDAERMRRRYEYLRDRFLSSDPDAAMLPREVLRATDGAEFDRALDRHLASGAAP